MSKRSVPCSTVIVEPGPSAVWLNAPTRTRVFSPIATIDESGIVMSAANLTCVRA
jgi:hypothetical protein